MPQIHSSLARRGDSSTPPPGTEVPG